MSLAFVPQSGPLILLREAGQGSPGGFLHGVKFLGTAVDELGTGWVSQPPFLGPQQPNFRGHGTAVELLNITMEVPLGPVAVRYKMEIGSVPAWDTQQMREFSRNILRDRNGNLLPYGLERTCQLSGWEYAVHQDPAAPGFLTWLQSSDWAALEPVDRGWER